MKELDSHIKIKAVSFRNEKLFFSLEDGREIGVPLQWYPKLYAASKEELMDFSISPSGYGVHWKQLDEDISAFGMLYHDQEKNKIFN